VVSSWPSRGLPSIDMFEAAGIAKALKEIKEMFGMSLDEG
jgi:hypothetical protein